MGDMRAFFSRLPRNRAPRGRAPIGSKNAITSRVPLCKPPQPAPQHSRLQFVEPTVSTVGSVRLVLHGPAILAQASQRLGCLCVVGHDRTAVPQGGQVFGGIEAKTAHRPPTSCAPTSSLGTVCL